MTETDNLPRKIGRYDIKRLLGAGAMGSVYLAEDPRIKRKLAIKVVKLDALRNENDRSDFLVRFQWEAEVSGVLNDPGIVTIYDVGDSEVGPFLAMEFVAGKPLDAYIKSGEMLAMELGAKLRIAAGIAAALDHAHNHGIIHRDVKPSNILVCGQTREAFLIDFGAARAPRSVTGMDPKDFEIGTQGYRSPEQARGEPVSPASDVFMLGATLHFAVHGECIYGLGTEADMHHRSRAGDVRPLSHSYHPKGLAELLERSTAPKMTDRHQTIDAFQEDLERVLWADFDD